VPSELESLFDHLLPEAIERMLPAPLASGLPPSGAAGRLRVAAIGRFAGRSAADLFTSEALQSAGSLLFVESDVLRVLHFVGGAVVGADSNVLFERLGRLLARARLLSAEEGARLVDVEEREGLAAAVRGLSPPSAHWGLERRTREIAVGLWFMPRGHYLVVEGPPRLAGLPTLALAPVELAMEGMRRYDEWRNRATESPATVHAGA
jgi:hypothetical protein